MAKKSLGVNTLNIFLILISLVLAFQFPFELFILAYAILGPLHYVTEINWLDNKNYFVKNRKQVWLLMVLTILIAVPFALVSYAQTADYFPKGSLMMGLRDYSGTFAFMAVITAIVLTLTQKWWIILTVLVSTFCVGYIFQGNMTYGVVFGGLLPTIIHVFLFTFFFMLYGAMKEKSKIGYAGSFLLLLAPLVIVFMPIEVRGMEVYPAVMEAYQTSKFGNLNYALAWSLGIFDKQPNYYLISDIGVRLQIFIAFAYTYHYLNWFSKTTVIGWHKVINKKKLVMILAIWIMSIIVYFWNYYAGFILLLFLSYLHVLVEFPLNWVSIKEVVKKIVGR